MARMVLGVFANRVDAEDAVGELERYGYDPRDISVTAGDSYADREAAAGGADIIGGILSGAITGGILGAIGGLLVGLGVIPGVGALLTAGPALALTVIIGAALGVTAGGIIGGLISLAVPSNEARSYKEGMQEREVLLIVPAHLGEEDEVKGVLKGYGAGQVKIFEQESYFAPTGTKGGKVEEKPPLKRRKKG